jgi:UDP-galactopyranose mutase
VTRRPLLVVGAGFAGATYARVLAGRGWPVDIIDRRPHVAGNAFDETDDTGTRVHRYGPHLFHTNNKGVVDWLSAFGEFEPYEHRVAAELSDGRHVPVPINRTTIAEVFGVSLRTPDDVSAFMATQVEVIAEPANAAEYLHARIGRRLTDLMFRPYTRKMWALELEELSPELVQRIPMRTDDEDRYFPADAHQFLPRDGYTALVTSILDHPLIRVTVGQPFDQAMRSGYAHCFNSMAIDEFFEETFGPLPYRSIRFHHRREDRSYHRAERAQVNFTDDSPMTRECDWQKLPGHTVTNGGFKTVTLEEPCDYRDNNMERFYPVKAADGRFEATYRKYRRLADEAGQLTFIGRCGTYRYLDMHQVINQSLLGARRWADAAG